MAGMRGEIWETTFASAGGVIEWVISMAVRCRFGRGMNQMSVFGEKEEH